jgi:hypothetical protein
LNRGPDGVQTLAAAGELQRELTYDGPRAAEATGNKGGRRPAVTGKTIADVRVAYLGGQTIASLAREHGVSTTTGPTRRHPPRVPACGLTSMDVVFGKGSDMSA